MLQLSCVIFLCGSFRGTDSVLFCTVSLKINLNLVKRIYAIVPRHCLIAMYFVSKSVWLWHVNLNSEVRTTAKCSLHFLLFVQLLLLVFETFMFINYYFDKTHFTYDLIFNHLSDECRTAFGSAKRQQVSLRSLSVFCFGRKAIRGKAGHLLIVLRPKQNNYTININIHKLKMKVNANLFWRSAN